MSIKISVKAVGTKLLYSRLQKRVNICLVISVTTFTSPVLSCLRITDAPIVFQKYSNWRIFCVWL